MESDATELAGFWKAYAWAEAHKKQVAYGAVGAVVVGLIVFFVIWQQQEKAAAARHAVSRTYFEQMISGNVGAGNPDAYLKVASEHAKSDAGARALLLAAASYFTQGKFAEAQVQFQKFASEYRESPLLGQALLGSAICLEAQGKTNEAVAAYKDLVERRPNEPWIAQAKFNLANLYEAQGKADQAASLFEDVSRASPYGSLGSEAGIRHEELLAAHPELAPKPVVSTNAPVQIEAK